MSLAAIWTELGILVVGVIIIVLLFVFKGPPFNTVYRFPDPRTWQVTDPTAWEKPEFDYGVYNQEIPDIEIAEIYCKALPTKCIYSRKDYIESDKPPFSCKTS